MLVLIALAAIVAAIPRRDVTRPDRFAEAGASTEHEDAQTQTGRLAAILAAIPRRDVTRPRSWAVATNSVERERVQAHAGDGRR